MYRMLFLLGVLRSGTTYFRNVLSSNRNIQAIGSELNRFWTTVGKAPCGRVGTCPPRSASDVDEEIRHAVTHFFDLQFRNRNRFWKVAHRGYRMAQYGNETLLKDGSPYYLLNKSTHLINKVSFVDAIFPGARYVYIIRDIHSHAYSLYRHLSRLQKQGWIAYYARGQEGACWSFRQRAVDGVEQDVDFETIPLYWLGLNSYCLRALDSVAPDRVMHVSYEELVQNPESVLERLAAFLGIGRLNTEFSDRPINNFSLDPLNEWKEKLNDSQKKYIEDTIYNNKSTYEYINSHLRS